MADETSLLATVLLAVGPRIVSACLPTFHLLAPSTLKAGKSNLLLGHKVYRKRTHTNRCYVTSP